MIHTIKTASGSVTIQAAGKPGKEYVSVDLVKAPWPPVNIQLTPEQAALLSQAFDLAAEEVGQGDPLAGAAAANHAIQTGQGIRA